MITVIFSSKMIFLHQIEMTAVFKDHFVGKTVILVEITTILVGLIKSGRSWVKDDGLVGLRVVSSADFEPRIYGSLDKQTCKRIASKSNCK